MDEKIFKIEPLPDGNMTYNGRTAGKSLKGEKNINKVNVLVREVLQNSLDARKDDAEFVKVEIFENKFNNEKFANLFEEIGDVLLKRYGNKNIEFIAFKDSNTKGLTGPIHKNEKRVAQVEERLINLVYSLGEAQSQSGAGGSWGYGKTTLYNFGNGLVLFYTRIKEDGEYKSRLIGVVIENPDISDEKKLLIDKEGEVNKGIAWFGNTNVYETKRYREERVIPICDEEIIENVLNIFGIEPYRGAETGTTTIIPYINGKEILENCMPNQDDSIMWFQCPEQGLEDYMKICISRWYTFRLNNKDLKNNPYLQVYYNGEKYEDEEKIFNIIKTMYNLASSKQTTDVIDGITYQNKEVTYNKKEIGRYIYTKINEKDLDYNPYIYFLDENKELESPLNKIGLYCRKPGMVISYEYGDSDWLKGVQKLENEVEYFIGLFVLNSKGEIKISDLNVNLEEYARGLEGADHAQWADKDNVIVRNDKGEDINIDTSKTKLINTIKRKIANIQSQEFKIEKPVVKGNWNDVSIKFSNLLLPKRGYGSAVSKKPSSTGREKSCEGSSRPSSKIVMQKFYNDGVTMKKEFDAYISRKGMKLIPKVDADKPIELDKFYKETNIIPFEVYGLKIKTIVFKNSTTTLLDRCFVKKDKKEYENDYLYLKANYNENMDKIISFEIKKLYKNIDYFEAEIEYKSLDDSYRIILDSKKLDENTKEESNEK